MSRKWESNVFGNQTFWGSRDRDDSNTALFASIAKKKFLMNSTYIMSRKWESNVFGNQTFLGSGDRNDSKTALFARIGQEKYF